MMQLRVRCCHLDGCSICAPRGVCRGEARATLERVSRRRQTLRSAVSRMHVAKPGQCRYTLDAARDLRKRCARTNGGGLAMTLFKRTVLKVGLAVLAAMGVQAAGAQGDSATNFPNRPIRMVVGFAAGGGNDLFARLVGQKLSENIGQPVVIENKPGAGGRIAVEYVKSQPADGYTVMVAASGQMAIAAAIYPKLSYHPTRDFLPLTMIASFPLILAGPANDTIKSVKDLVAYGKANPDKSNYATSSPAFTITTVLFKHKLE